MTTTPVTDADRLVAEGVPIPTDLGTLHLRYGFRALRSLEEKYGGLEALQEAMEGVTGKGAAFGPLLDILVPGLLHTGHTEDQLIDALQPRSLGVYVDAMVEAMRQAFPDAVPASAEGNAQPANRAARRSKAGSRGQSGTTSQRAATAAPTPSSGT